MDINVKILLSRGMEAPAYATEGSAAIDLRAAIDEGTAVTIEPGERALIPTGLAISPETTGVVAIVAARSGLAIKQGICLSNGIGVIDSDYRGEIFFAMVNNDSEPKTVENGERIDDGYAESYYYGKVVRFSFRGVGYEFSADSDDALTDEELRERTQWLIEDVREADDRYFYRGTVTLTENGGILSSDKLEGDIDLFAEGIKVTAVHITDNNELVILDELREGECVFAYYESSYSPAVAVYYVDPLPSQTPDGPVEYTAFDIIPELEYYRDNPESTLLKLTREHSPANPTEFNRHIYITNAEDAALWLDRLAEITLTDADAPPADIDGQHTVFVMRFEDKSGENSRVIINYECGMIKRGNKWYSCDSFPAWEGGSVYSFSCMNSAMYAYGGNVRYPSIAGIEFVPDTKQDYEYPEDHYSIRLEGEVGEITVYDETHFYYNGVYYLVTSEKNFYQLYH